MKNDYGISVYTLWPSLAFCTRTQPMEFSKFCRKMAVLAGFFLCMLFSNQCIKKTDNKEIFRDKFDRSNSSTLGSDWTINMPSVGTLFTINGNMAKPLGGSGTTEVTVPSALYNQKVKGSFKASAKFVISGGDYESLGYIIARSAASDVPTDGYLCGYYYSLGTASPKKYYFSLRKVSSGTVTSIADVAMHQLTSGKSDTITFTVDNSTLKCEISGNSTIGISITDSSFGDGYTGLLGGGNNSQYLFFDDFLIEKL